MNVTPLTPHIGAEIMDVDLSCSLDNETFAGIHQAFLDWGVLVFRDQQLTREQHKEFARRFGKLHNHPMNYQGTDDPEVLMVKTTKDSAYTAGNGWHTDVTCDEYPPMGSMLYMKQVPGYGGGDTLYADMYLAYEMLSETMKAMLADLVAVHDGALPYVGAYKTTPPEGGYPKNEHPVVVTHPETGRKVLYVNAGFTSHIKDLNPLESKALLGILFDHIATVPRLTCRVSWEPGTLTFWDNRCTQHHAIWDYYPHERYGERVSIVAAERPGT
ncbi:MAG: TauD/TfdA family dioxygenase [Proteobacteria bacterium]|nr:TauD/TfdA family dioxygenase [Pseudomonadota bacterium]